MRLNTKVSLIFFSITPPELQVASVRPLRIRPLVQGEVAVWKMTM